MCNRRLFGLPVHHIIRSDSVWNSLSLCSNSSSNSSSSSSISCSSSSSQSSSSSNSSRHLASACSGLQCITAATRQCRADPIGSQADPQGRRWLVGYYLTVSGHNPTAMQAVGSGLAAGPGNWHIQLHRGWVFILANNKINLYYLPVYITVPLCSVVCEMCSLVHCSLMQCCAEHLVLSWNANVFIPAYWSLVRHKTGIIPFAVLIFPVEWNALKFSVLFSV